MHLHLSLKQIFPSLLIYFALIASAMLFDYVLHLFGLVWIGRYFGFIGSSLVVLSFVYSMKKRKMISWGSAKYLLQAHELLGWVGALMILVHGGVHFNSIIPWLAIFSMFVVVGSGLTGKVLLKEAKVQLQGKEIELREKKYSGREIEQELLSYSAHVDIMKRWRKIHMPLSMIFFALASLHIIVILLLWRWQ